MEKLAKELQEIGLSEKEARVYLAVLELGQETAQNISKKADVNRATTYVILESLQKKGIVSVFEQGKKTVFIAEGPEALHNIIREQEEELERRDRDLDEMMPQLMSTYNLHPDKPKVTFYEGKEGLKKMLDEHFMKTKSKNARIIFPKEQVATLFDEEEKAKIRNRRLDNKIKLKAIYSTLGGESLANSELAKVYEISNTDYPIQCEIEIFDEKFLIAALSGNISGVVVENQQIASTMKSVFDLALNSSKKI